MIRAARRRDGRFYTPVPLARALVRRVLGPLVQGRPREAVARLEVCDPACGDGVFLVEAWRLLARRLGDPRAAARRLCGVDTDGGALRRAAAAFPPGARPELIEDDALRRDWGGKTFDAILGNPPWISFSGRHAQPLAPEARALLAERFETFRGWPSLHGPFVELAVRLCRGRAGLLLPTQVLDLDGYGPVRAFVRSRARVDEPLPDLGERAFPGVVQPCAALIFEIGGGGGAGGEEPFALDAPPDAGLLDHLDGFARPPRCAFADIGVHTGNCAGRLLDRGGAPLREGRDIHAFRLDAPRRRVRPGLRPEPGETFRVGPPERYLDVPIVLRQTAARPIAALHEPPAYFRNSVLACRGLPGIADDLAVAWLNSTVIARYHRARVREAAQRSFPQLKIRHLRDLPLPPVSRIPPAAPHLARLVAREERRDLAGELDREVSRWFGLDDASHDRLHGC